MKVTLQLLTTTMEEVDDFGSVAWDSAPTEGANDPLPSSSRLPVQNDEPQDLVEPISTTDAVFEVSVHSPVKELEGTKEAFVSYLVSVKVSSFLIALLLY